MRLLDLVTGDFVEFSHPSEAPPYAILSHRWDASEQTYQDIQVIQNLCEKNRRSSALALPQACLPSALPSPPAGPQSIWDPDSGLSDKVRHACEVARADGFRHLWIDSCCIDKTSSSELSESINSMFAWYRDAEVCYTFLADVPTSPLAVLESEGSAFRSSVWFTRGWTLQELIAPHRLVFLSQTWEPLGTKASLSKLIGEITGIPAFVLAGGGRGAVRQPLDRCSVAQRMSWAAHRETTKVEDQAYALLGIFDIQMALLYGEGKRAFRRLQEEILRRIPDQTIFAWGNVYPESLSIRTVDRFVTQIRSHIRNIFRSHPNDTATARENEVRPHHFNFYCYAPSTMFADSPRDFAGAGQVVKVPFNTFRDLLTTYCEMSPQEYTFTPHGIRADFPFLPLTDCLISNRALYEAGVKSMNQCLAVLACEQSNFRRQLLCCVCLMRSRKSPVCTLRRGFLIDGSQQGPMTFFTLFRLSLPNDHDRGLRDMNLRPHTVYLDHPERTPSLPLVPCNCPEIPDTLSFTLPIWSRSALDTQGYSVSLETPSKVGGGFHRITLSPHTPQTDSGLYRWNIVADLGYESRPRMRTISAVVRVAGGNEVQVSFTRSLEWTHHWHGSVAAGWHWDLLDDNGTLELDAQGHESVKMQFRVRLASLSSYRVDVELIDGRG